METLNLALVKGVWKQATAGKVAFQNISVWDVRISFSAITPTVVGEVMESGDGRIVPAGETVWLKCDYDSVTVTES